MVRKPPTSCAECRRLRAQLAAQQALINSLRKTVGELQQQGAHLQEQLAGSRKDSSNSSKPPSSDLVKPPKPPPPQGQDKRPAGGQPGHPQHQRAPIPAELLNGGTHTYTVEICPGCGHGLQPAPLCPHVVQQIEIETVPLCLSEHRAYAGWCTHCQKAHYAELPSDIAHGGLVGPRLTTLIAYLKGACHASYSTIRRFLRDVLEVILSRGQLAKVIGKVSQALDTPYQELLEQLPAQARLNVDETGHKDRGEPWWTWCFRASLFTLFKIDPTRSAEVLLEVLGAEFNGVLGCDYFSAYRRYMRECNVVVQFCLAHLIRDVKFLTSLPDPRDRVYGERLREALRTLFGVIHRRQELSARAFQAQLIAARDAVWRQATDQVPPTKASQNLAKRFREHGQAYFEFVTTPGVEPTNNLAEQAIRFVVIDRHVTQGTRGEAGRRWCERIWTVIATCSQQGRSVFDYLYAAVKATYQETSAPSLLTNAS
jgi:transposase